MINQNNLLKNLKSIFMGRDHADRSARTKLNIFLLVFFHSFNVVFTMALVPVSINYLDNYRYGIWMTINSLILWLGYLDFGIGNGLRNKVSEALARQQFNKARQYVSTAYFIFFIAITVLITLFTAVNRFIDWQPILKIPDTLTAEIPYLMILVAVIFLIQLILKLINTIISADQKPALNGLLSVCVNFFTLLIIFILYKLGIRSFSLFCFISLFTPVVVLTLSSLYLFRTLYKDIAPSLSAVDLKLTGDIANLGLQFFIIQISGLIVFTTQNILITQTAGPEQVTVYNVAYRYFSLITLVFGVILTPFWSAFTDAYVRKDFDWINKALNKLLIFWAVMTGVTVLFVFLAGPFYKLWVGKSVVIPFNLSLSIGLLTIITNWNNIFAYLLNGTGKIRLQFYTAIFIIFANIPLCIYLASGLKMGSAGIVLASCITLFFSFIYAPFQCRKIILNKAAGIWNK